MIAQHYAQALYRAVRENEKEWERYIKNLVTILEQKGHRKLLPSIFKEYKKLLEQKKGVSVITISRATDNRALGQAQEMQKEYFQGMESEISVNEDVIGGFQVLSDTKMVDASYKTALLTLYRNMTS